MLQEINRARETRRRLIVAPDATAKANRRLQQGATSILQQAPASRFDDLQNPQAGYAGGRRAIATHNKLLHTSNCEPEAHSSERMVHSPYDSESGQG